MICEYPPPIPGAKVSWVATLKTELIIKDVCPAKIIFSIFVYLLCLGLAYQQFLKDLKLSCQTELEYLLKKADRSVCPRRPDYNRLFQAYCREKYGDRNGSAMFEQLSEVIREYQLEKPDLAIAFQAYEESGEAVTPFILVMITDLMKRVHQMVSELINV